MDPFGLLENIDTTWLLLSTIPSTIGFVLFVYGRKQGLTPHLVAGVLLMVYPLIATTTTTLLAGGALIGGGLWYAIQAGW